MHNELQKWTNISFQPFEWQTQNSLTHTQLSNNTTKTENDGNDALILSDVVDCESLNSQLAISKWITKDRSVIEQMYAVSFSSNQLKLLVKPIHSVFLLISSFLHFAIWENIIW